MFWSTYSEADQRWQINFRTRANGQWSLVAPLSALAPFATMTFRRQPWAVADNAGMLWLFWLELVVSNVLALQPYDGTNWTLAVPATFPLMPEPTPASKVHRLSCSIRPMRRNACGSFGTNRTNRRLGSTALAYRVPGQGKPEPQRCGLERDPRLPPGPAESQDREPAALVKTNGDVELFWSSTTAVGRSGGQRSTAPTHTWGTAEMLINSPYTQCDPLPIPRTDGTMLVYHANESVKYTSTVYGATETVDHRYAGSTTIDVATPPSVRCGGNSATSNLYV